MYCPKDHVICFIILQKYLPPTLGAAAAAAATTRLLHVVHGAIDDANLAPLSVISQLLWPSATTNYGGRRPQIGSL